MSRLQVALLCPFLALLCFSSAAFANPCPGRICPTSSQDSSLYLMQLRAASLQTLSQEDIRKRTLPELPDIQTLLDNAEATIESMAESLNETIGNVLLNAVSAIRELDDTLEVAETTAESIGAIAGGAADNLIEELTRMAAEMRAHISQAMTRMVNFRDDVRDTVYFIGDSINNTAYAVLNRFTTALEKIGDIDTQSALASTSSNRTISKSKAPAKTEKSVASLLALLDEKLGGAPASPLRLTSLEARRSEVEQSYGTWVQALKTAMADDCLTEQESDNALRALNAKEMSDEQHKEAVTLFRRIDGNRDGCISTAEWNARQGEEDAQDEDAERAAKETHLPAAQDQAMSLLMIRASSRSDSSAEAALEHAVQRKGSSPCQSATMAVNRANSSVLSLEDHLEKANDTFYVLLDRAVDMGEDALSSVSEVVQSGLDAAEEAGLPSSPLKPVRDALAKMGSISSGFSVNIDEMKANISQSVGELLGNVADGFSQIVEELSDHISGVCST